MGNTADVTARIPGLKFRVESSTIAQPTAAGARHGTIRLHCEFVDKNMFQAAVDKLDGFKIFSSLSEELVDAIGEELNNTFETLESTQARVVELEAELVAEREEKARLQGLLAVIEGDLGDSN